MLFDRPPSELPVAMVRPRARVAALGADARRWLALRWRWLRPRTVPVIVAFMGMLAVLGSARYLSNLAQETPERVVVRPVADQLATSGDELPTIQIRFAEWQNETAPATK